GAGTSIYLVMVLAARHLACPWCLASAAVLFLAFLVAWVPELHRNALPLGRGQASLAVLVFGLAAFAGVAAVREAPVDRLDPRKLAEYASEISDYKLGVGQGSLKVVLFGEIACAKCRVALVRWVQPAGAC